MLRYRIKYTREFKDEETGEIKFEQDFLTCRTDDTEEAKAKIEEQVLAMPDTVNYIFRSISRL